MFDNIIVAVAADTGKSPLFSLEERVAMAEKVFVLTALYSVLRKFSPRSRIFPLSRFKGCLWSMLHAGMSILCFEGFGPFQTLNMNFRLRS